MAISVFTDYFNSRPLRFILKDKDLFVSKEDLIQLLSDFMPQDYKEVADQMVSHGIPYVIGDKSDIASGIIGEREVGAVIHFHAVGNLIVLCSDLLEIDDAVLREAVQKAKELGSWYVAALSRAEKHFKLTKEDMLMSVKRRLDLINPPYVVEVMYDIEDNIPSWIGTCDKLHLVTEGRTYEELQSKVWEIAPEMHQLQGFGKETDNIRIAFVQTETHAEYQRLEM